MMGVPHACVLFMQLFLVVLLSAANCGDASGHDSRGHHERARAAGSPTHNHAGTAFMGRHLLPSWHKDAAASSHVKKCPQLLPGSSLERKWEAMPHCTKRCPPHTSTALHNVKTGREFIDHYEVLGVTAAADPSEIKRVFRELSRKYHPDVNKGRYAFTAVLEYHDSSPNRLKLTCAHGEITGSDEDIYRRITAAYNILSDPDRRASYDSRRLMQIGSGALSERLSANFEDALQRQWTTAGDGHV
jgi:hypothetical protein